MNVIIISGSHRLNSESSRVAHYISERLPQLSSAQSSATQCEILDLAVQPLPLWDEGIWQSDPTWMARLAPLSQRLADADGFVIVSPEWSGMVPPALKNFFLMWTDQELAHKPGLIVSVSAGTGGAYPVAELRMSSYKNNQLCYLPNHVIVRHVNTVLHRDPEANHEESDHSIRERIDHSLRVLQAYCRAFKQIRATDHFDLHQYKFGM